MTTYGEDFSEKMAEQYVFNYAQKGAVNWWTGKPWEGQDFCVSPEKIIADMDKNGVDKACIMGYCMMPMNNYKPDLADYMADCMKKYPGRLYGYISVDPIGGLSQVRLIEDSIKNKGLAGVKIMPGYSNCAINDRRMWPIFEVTQELNVPILIHTGHSSLPQSFSHTYNNPLFIEEIAYDFPNLKIIMAHTGMHWPEDGLTVINRFPNVYGDFAFWRTLPIHMLAETLVMAKTLGCLKKLFWGSDYPEIDFAEDLKMYRSLPEYCEKYGYFPALTKEDIDGVLGDNFARVMNFVN